MADQKFDTLSSIYQMMTPNIGGVPVLNSGEEVDANKATALVFRSIFNIPGGGLKTSGTIITELKQQLKNADDEKKKQLKSVLRMYSSAGHFKDSDFTWHLLTPNPDDSSDKPIEIPDADDGMKEIMGFSVAPAKTKKKYGIILSDENFISPMTQGARDAEIFLNGMPSFVMSRCVPYLSAEFVFDRPGLSGKSQTLTAPGLLKFLLGAQDTTGNGATQNFADGTANRIMLAGNSISVTEVPDAAASGEQTDGKQSAKELPYNQLISGMEMFTAPQTLQNMDILPRGSRYVPVLDPTRPLASIENVTINVTPTYGLMSYKTAQMQIKVHDRSRLHELADLIKPQIYTRSTIWLTYGWRHPREPGNPYADFINNTMMTREAYGIVNASYDFDHLGQATLSLQLFTRGARELRDIRITDGLGSFESVKKRIELITQDIKRLRHELKLDKPTGILKEIRSFQLLEAASNGAEPNIDVNEVSKVLDELEKSFLEGDSKIDKAKADELKELLENLYAPAGGGADAKFAYKEQFEKVSKQATDRLLKKVQTGADPFLMSSAKDDIRKSELGDNYKPHPFAKLIDDYNGRGKRDKENRKNSVNPRLIVSFGKLFSTFLGNGVATLDAVDELQMVFYPMNLRAGLAAGTNIAEFPIDMSVFLDQYRDYISRKRTDRITIEEFLKLAVDAQLGNVRGPGFNLFGHLEPYDPKTNESKLKKGQQDEFESALAQKDNKFGPFKMPVINVYVESAHVGRNGTTASPTGFDLLEGFQRDVLALTGAHDKNYTKVMRVHIFDKAVDPYPTSTAILKGDDGTSDRIPKGLAAATGTQFKKSNIELIEQALKESGAVVEDLIQIDDVQGVIVRDENANKRVKDFVSQTIPTIVYGSNATMVKDAKVSTKQDALLTSVQMMSGKSGRPSVTQPNGGGTMGLPLRIIPATVQVTTMGCPVLRYAQIFFFDYGTGTTIDNKYVVTGLNHSIGPGKFETSLDMTWYDAYGQYESTPSLMNYLKLIDAPDE